MGLAGYLWGMNTWLKLLIRNAERAGYVVTTRQELRDIKKAHAWLEKLDRKLEKRGIGKMNYKPDDQADHHKLAEIDRRLSEIEIQLTKLDSRTPKGVELDDEYRELRALRRVIEQRIRDRNSPSTADAARKQQIIDAWVRERRANLQNQIELFERQNDFRSARLYRMSLLNLVDEAEQLFR